MVKFANQNYLFWSSCGLFYYRTQTTGIQPKHCEGWGVLVSGICPFFFFPSSLLFRSDILNCFGIDCKRLLMAPEKIYNKKPHPELQVCFLDACQLDTYLLVLYHPGFYYTVYHTLRGLDKYNVDVINFCLVICIFIFKPWIYGPQFQSCLVQCYDNMSHFTTLVKQ